MVSETIHFENNKFEGTFPDIFSRLSHLKELHLSINRFTGTLHTSIGTLTELSKRPPEWVVAKWNAFFVKKFCFLFAMFLGASLLTEFFFSFCDK